MKKLLYLLVFCAPIFAGAQTLCLQTMCNAVQAKAGDQVTLAALLTAGNKVGSISINQASGPNKAIMGASTNGWSTSLADTFRIQVTGLVVGTYIFNVVGKDMAGGTVAGVDTIVVSPGTICPVCPQIPGASSRVLSWTVVQSGGVGRIQVTYWDGSTALLP